MIGYDESKDEDEYKREYWQLLATGMRQGNTFEGSRNEKVKDDRNNLVKEQQERKYADIIGKWRMQEHHGPLGEIYKIKAKKLDGNPRYSKHLLEQLKECIAHIPLVAIDTEGDRKEVTTMTMGSGQGMVTFIWLGGAVWDNSLRN